MGSPEEQALAADAARGDRRALEALLSRCVDRIHRICRRILVDEHDAFDATQEALIAITRSISGFDGRAAFSTWMYRIATNAALDEARRRARRAVPTDPDLLPERRAPEESSPMESVVARVTLDQALAALPAEQRAALALREIAELDYQSIASALGVPIGTVRSRIARGRVTLAGYIGEHAGTSTALADVQPHAFPTREPPRPDERGRP